MSKLINLRFARFVKAILDIVFATMVFASVGLVAWIIASPIIVNQTDIIGSVSVSIAVTPSKEPGFDLNISSQIKDKIHSSIVDVETAYLKLETSDILLIVISNSTKLFVAIGLAFIFYLLREILQNILEGHPFSSTNAQHMRRLGYTVFLVGFFHPLVEYIATTEMLNRLQITSSPITTSYSLDIGILLISLLILLLSYIWNYGVELEQDSALTV